MDTQIRVSDFGLIPPLTSLWPAKKPAKSEGYMLHQAAILLRIVVICNKPPLAL
jgi:hypothetical protein